MNGGAKGLTNESPRANRGTQNVTWVRGTVSDTVEVEVKGDFYRSDCVLFAD